MWIRSRSVAYKAELFLRFVEKLFASPARTKSFRLGPLLAFCSLARTETLRTDSGSESGAVLATPSIFELTFRIPFDNLLVNRPSLMNTFFVCAVAVRTDTHNVFYLDYHYIL